MPKITELYAWVLADSGPDDEGVPWICVNGTWMPMMSADIDRALVLQAQAQALADQTGKELTLIRSGGVEIVTVVVPVSEQLPDE